MNMDHPFHNSKKDFTNSTRRPFDDTTVYEADRQPCIVCGHPTGDCSGESGPPEHIAGMGATPSLKQEQTFYLEEDIYEERQITPFNKIKVLVHRRGKQIPLEEAERLGLWSPKS